MWTTEWGSGLQPDFILSGLRGRTGGEAGTKGRDSSFWLTIVSELGSKAAEARAGAGDQGAEA